MPDAHRCQLEHQADRLLTRRALLAGSGAGLGWFALLSLLSRPRLAGAADAPHRDAAVFPGHFPARARRVISLFMSGGPSHLDLFDHKPRAIAMHGRELPNSVKGAKRITTMTRFQKEFPVAGSPYRFARHGDSGQSISELLPHTAGIADELAIVRSLHGEAINHDPAVMLMQSGSTQAGFPTLGAWLSYGLGSENENLPAFVVLLSGPSFGQPLLSRYWGNGFLPSRHQGIQFRTQGDPVLYLSNPAGLNRADRRTIIDGINDLNRVKLRAVGDPEIQTRIGSFELAYRMQTSVPELMDLSTETREALELYGAEPGKSSFANNCLLARRLAERGVRFIQLYHKDWDHHQDLPKKLPQLCRETDRGAAALVLDLKRRGLLDDTLVVWGGEFGRTAYSQGKISPGNFGRDHHPHCFTVWLAGGGIQGGLGYGKTDDFGYNVAEDPVHIHDLQATILHLLGINHKQLTYRYQGRDFRVTDVGGRVVTGILA